MSSSTWLRAKGSLAEGYAACSTQLLIFADGTIGQVAWDMCVSLALPARHLHAWFIPLAPSPCSHAGMLARNVLSLNHHMHDRLFLLCTSSKLLLGCSGLVMSFPAGPLWSAAVAAATLKADGLKTTAAEPTDVTCGNTGAHRLYGKLLHVVKSHCSLAVRLGAGEREIFRVLQRAFHKPGSALPAVYMLAAG